MQRTLSRGTQRSALGLGAEEAPDGDPAAGDLRRFLDDRDDDDDAVTKSDWSVDELLWLQMYRDSRTCFEALGRSS